MMLLVSEPVTPMTGFIKVPSASALLGYTLHGPK